MPRKKTRILGQNRRRIRAISFHEFYKSRETPPKPEYVLVKDQSKGGNKLKWHTLEDAARILSLPALSVPPLEEPEPDKPTSTRRGRKRTKKTPASGGTDPSLPTVTTKNAVVEATEESAVSTNDVAALAAKDMSSVTSSTTLPDSSASTTTPSS